MRQFLIKTNAADIYFRHIYTEEIVRRPNEFQGIGPLDSFVLTLNKNKAAVFDDFDIADNCLRRFGLDTFCKIVEASNG